MGRTFFHPIPRAVFPLLTAFLLPVCSLLGGDLRVGGRAPDLNGIDIRSGERTGLYRLMTDIFLERDQNGQLVVGQNGKYRTVFRHNVLVLNFFSRHCIPCIREIPVYRRVAAKFKGRAVKMLYVNADGDLTQAGMKALADKHTLTLPLLYAHQQEVMRTYRPRALPKLVVIGRDKKVAHIMTGFDENFETALSNAIRSLLP